jgi:SAM-dependent methyltransferase
MDIEYPSCPLCHSESHRNAYSKFTPYKVVRCHSCGFYYLYPRLTETAILNLYADDDYFEGEDKGYTSYSEQEVALRATFKRVMLNLRKNKLTGGSLLEIGCGYGYLLDEARNFFEFRVGTDFSERAVKQAKSRADFVYPGGIEQVPIQEKFDLIIATHVIEHVYQPKAFLEKITKHLHPGGVAVIATPDMGSFWRYLMGHKWPSFKLPEHVLYFDKRSLSTLMKEVGLFNIQPLPYPHAFPLPLVAAKLGIKIPLKLSNFNLWMPATTLALYGRFYG